MGVGECPLLPFAILWRMGFDGGPFPFVWTISCELRLVLSVRFFLFLESEDDAVVTFLENMDACR